MKTTPKLLSLFAALLCFGGAANAATISLDPMSDTIQVGDTYEVVIRADFSDVPTIGGGFDIFFDSSRLAFASFEFFDSAIIGDDPAFRRDPDVFDGVLNGIAFGNFDGIDGVFDIGILRFSAVAVGLINLVPGPNLGGPPNNPGGFFSTNGDPIFVNFVGTSAEITQVPLPAAIWLILAGVASLAGFRRSAIR